MRLARADEVQAPAATERATWRAVAVPSEHGGWGLTLEPVLLGLLVAPSWTGAAIGAAAFLAFLLRTPAKLVVIDRRRGRWLPRTTVAARIASTEAALLVGLAVAATVAAGAQWWVPVAVAAPLVAVEWWYEVRSRGRRLVPELCGATGIAAVVAAMSLAAGQEWRPAIGLWLVLAARSIGAIPFVRVQIARLRRGEAPRRSSHVAQMAALAVALAAVALDASLWLGALGVAAIAAVQTWWLYRPPTPAKVLGVRQMVLGLALVAATAAGVLAG